MSNKARPTSDIEPIVGIQFGIFSPEEIERRSVVEITNAGTFDGNEPRISGLFDPRMGTLENGKTCRSCGQTNHNCPGHFGHYKLARPVYYIQFFPMVLNILECICIRCSKLLIDKSRGKLYSKKKGEVRWKLVLANCKNIVRCGQDTEDGCGARQPDRYNRESIARIVAEWNIIDSNAEQKEKEKEKVKERQVLECEYVLRLFRRITDEDVDFMGLNRYWCRPDWMICSVLAIPPPQVRPSVIQDNNQRSEDDLTHKLFEIINTNNTLQDKINNNAAKNIIDDQYTVLQYHVATLVDNQIPGVAPSAQRSGRPLKSIQQRLGSKEGRIRYNIQGKRVEFSGRSVITPDPNISIEELGMPIKIAMNLTMPERVTQFNRNKMYKLIQNGADNYPGAKTVVRKDGRIISLKHVNTKEIVLHYGDVVNRHLMDGDTVLFNRQPTLHRMSMMGHKVKVLPYNTFRLNVSVTSPYNADFDGDEMNCHVPQSYEASIELAEIAAVPMQIITPRFAKPVIGIVQDTLIGSYRLTQPNVNFNRREFMNMMMWNRHFDGRMPEPIKGRYTGHQILSKILPSVNMAMGNKRYNEDKENPNNFVKIVEGLVSQGIFDKDIFSKEGKGIIHTIFKDYGPKETVHFLDCMQSTIEQFLVYNGFSVGISDLIADVDTKNKMDEKIRARKAEVENIMMQIHLDLFTNNTGKSNKDEFENRVFSALNKATEESGNDGLASLASENRLVSMVRAGSKGSNLNIAQMLACVGQQAPEGRRIPLGFTDRTLPHFKKYDDGAEARGFVESSFIKGLSPQEFFFHAMSGREGLIDTAVKSVTSDTPIIIIENGQAKRVEIGPWIDEKLKISSKDVEQYDETQANLELLNITNDITIPTMDYHGKMSWGKITAVTRHDPGEKIYEIKTHGGRDVIVSAGKSLLIYDTKTSKFEEKLTPDVKIGDYVPVTINLPEPPNNILNGINITEYINKLKSIEKYNYQQFNDVVLDTITEINEMTPDKYPKLYDLTVPSTFNFMIENGLNCRDTADTGYVQRQLVKAMEDLVTQNDGSVRDAKMNIIQRHYGEDGINATMIEAQSYAIAALSKDQIIEEFGLVGKDLSQIMVEDTIREDDKEVLDKFVEEVLEDQDIMVKNVIRYKDVSNKLVYSPVNIERLMQTIRVKFNLSESKRTDLTPTYVINGINKVIMKTQGYHRIWCALLRFYLAPHKLIGKDRFTKDAFDTLCELLVVKNYQARAQPGEQVGIIAAQSIGEPSTQMTLNSVDYDTNIVIMKNGKIWTPEIGSFIDDYYESLPEESEKIQRLPNNQIYIELNDGNDWKALSTDEDGKMMWTKLEAITRHPVINEDGSNTILEVLLESGRTVKATKALSFLTNIGGKVLGIKGSDLKVGDEIPIANSLDIGEYTIKEINLREILPPTEWLYGSEINKAIEIMNKSDRHWFQKNQGKLFTVPYNRSDTFRDAMGGRNTNTFQNGCVYPKRTRPDTSHIPETIALTKEFGFFVGAYIAEGMSNSTQINITNNDPNYIQKVKDLMDEWNVGTHIVSEDRFCEKTNIKGHTTSLVIHSTLLAKVMGYYFGKVSYEKTLPDWVLQASDDFVKGLVDGYISGDGSVDAKTGCIRASSVSKELIDKFVALFARYNIFTTLYSYMPEIKNFKSVSKNYSLNIIAKYSKVFAETFTLSITHKQDKLEHHFIHNDTERRCVRKSLNNIVWDKVKRIKEVTPLKEWVYDLTVEKTRNFTTLVMTGLKDTFHLAGVASKSNVTRGVPRLKELLKVTQNPKAISLTIPLKKEFRNSIDKARQVAQDLELTLLKDIVTKAAIYFDPKKEESVLEEDRKLLQFYKMFETKDDAIEWSKWLLRFEFDRSLMFNKNISLDTVAFALKQKFTGEINMIYSDFNSDKLVMRIRLTDEFKSSTKDDILNLKKLQTRLLTTIVIRGIPGIKSVSYRKDTNYCELINNKYEPITQYILDTDGSNFLEIMNHPYVNGNAVLSSHVHDIYENLGVEAARAILLSEITTLFMEAGGVDYRHLGLLCDVMTRNGKLMSVDRYGINKNDIGPLAKSSFEEVEKILLKAALFGEVDPVIGVSANIMTGQPIRGGTTFSEILFDEQVFMRLQEGLAPVADEEEEEYEPNEEQIENELYESQDDNCAIANLKLNVTLGTQLTSIVEEPDIEATFVDE